MNRKLQYWQLCLVDNVDVKEDIPSFYEAVKAKRMEIQQGIMSDVDPQHEELIPMLRPYQVDAVRWMLYREMERPDLRSMPHPLYEEFKLPEGKTLFYNRYGGL